jgi:phosphoribosylformylglycinamidine cyclo-ligase
MYRTFNCGIGMVIIVPVDVADAASELLTREGETVFNLGQVQTASNDVPFVEII